MTLALGDDNYFKPKPGKHFQLLIEIQREETMKEQLSRIPEISQPKILKKGTLTRYYLENQATFQLVHKYYLKEIKVIHIKMLESSK